jgi:hypothetical protein
VFLKTISNTVEMLIELASWAFDALIRLHAQHLRGGLRHGEAPVGETDIRQELLQRQPA